MKASKKKNCGIPEPMLRPLMRHDPIGGHSHVWTFGNELVEERAEEMDSVVERLREHGGDVVALLCGVPLKRGVAGMMTLEEAWRATAEGWLDILKPFTSKDGERVHP